MGRRALAVAIVVIAFASAADAEAAAPRGAAPRARAAAPKAGPPDRPDARVARALRSLAEAKAAMTALMRDQARRRYHHQWERAIQGLLRAARGKDAPAATLEAARARYALYRWSANEADREAALQLAARAAKLGSREAPALARAIRREAGEDRPAIAPAPRRRSGTAGPAARRAPAGPSEARRGRPVRERGRGITA